MVANLGAIAEMNPAAIVDAWRIFKLLNPVQDSALCVNPWYGMSGDISRLSTADQFIAMPT